MKTLFLILLTYSITTISFGQNKIEEVWLTQFKGDSLTQAKYFYELNINTKDFNSRTLFEPNRDTFEIVITYYNRNGKDSIQQWKYSNRPDSYTLHWKYNENDQLITHFTTMGDQTNNDTVIYEYDELGQLIRETRLYENYFMYDSTIYRNEKILLKIRKDPNQILHRKEYKYNRHGQITKILTLSEKGVKGEEISYKYDSKNRLSKFKIIRHKNDFNPKQIEISRKFRYNNSGKTIEYKEIDNNYHTSRTYHYEYDSSGVKTKTTVLDNYNEMKSIYEYEIKTLHNKG